MANVMSPEEILKIAIKVEERGKILYEALGKKAKNEKLKGMWKYLKEQEEAHRKVFQEILLGAADYIVYEMYSGEYEAYLKALASNYIFTLSLIDKKTKELFNSDVQALNFAISIEKDSIITYSALREYVLPAKQAVLDRVIDEEKKHLVQLTLLKNN